MSLTLVTPPAAPPISLAEIKAQVRVEDGSEDALLMGYVRSATDMVEQMSGLRLIDQTWEYSTDAFPERCGWLRLPLAPLLAVEQITYVNEQGISLTLDSSVYLVRGIGSVQPGRIILGANQQWPTTWRGAGAVVIRARYGWLDHNAVPEALRQAVMMLAAHWFDNRSTTAAGPDYGPVSHTPFGVRELVEPYRVWAV
jgi:uncharacterized phiE125 gp8 family phage protein